MLLLCLGLRMRPHFALILQSGAVLFPTLRTTKLIFNIVAQALDIFDYAYVHCSRQHILFASFIAVGFVGCSEP